MPYVCNDYCNRSADFKENTTIQQIPHYIERRGKRISSFEIGGFSCSVCGYFGVAEKTIVKCPCCGKQFKTGLFRQKRLLTLEARR